MGHALQKLILPILCKIKISQLSAETFMELIIVFEIQYIFYNIFRV